MALADTHQIVAVKTSLPSGRVTKRSENWELAENKKSDPARSNISVDIFAKRLSDWRAHNSRVRRWLDDQGLPWGFRGQRLVPNSKIDEIIRFLENARIESDRFYKDFLRALPGFIEEDKREHSGLGELFNQGDYQDVITLEDKGNFEILRDTVPDPESDPRAGWSQQQVDEMRTAMKRQEESNVKEATIDLTRRIEQPLRRIIEAMEKYKGSKSGRFTNSLIPNVRELVDAMVGLNLKDDRELENIRKDLLTGICPLEEEDLRKDPGLRKETKEKAEAILNRVGNFGASL